MSTRLLNDKDTKPDDKALAESLGSTAACWQEVRSRLTALYGELTEEWKHYGKKTGWLLKVLYKKRNLFFFIPEDGYFSVSFAFGEKAVQAVENSNLPDALKMELRGARKYAEGRGIRIYVRSSNEIATILKLVEIKVDH